MSFFQRAKRVAWRALTALFKVLYFLMRALTVLLLFIIPIPIRLKPEITNPYRRNQVTQLEQKKKPG